MRSNRTSQFRIFLSFFFTFFVYCQELTNNSLFIDETMLNLCQMK